MDISKLKSIFLTKYWLAIIGGAVFALLVWKILELELRYVVAISGGLVVLSIGMMAIYHIEDFILYALVFNIPFSVMGKWLFRQDIYWGLGKDAWAPARGISIGLAEMLLIGGYLVWFAQVFIAKTKSLPKFKKIDFFIVFLLFAQAISLLSAPYKLFGSFDIFYNIKHALIYFFIAHKVKRRHLRLIIIILLFAILLESSLAIYEHTSGNVGFFLLKGKVADADFGAQYSVRGIESFTRGSGTTIDSHALGLYYAMLLPVPFVLLMMNNFLKPSTRVALGMIFIIGVIGLVVTFARAGWMSFALSTIFAMGIILLAWKQGRAVIIIIAICIVAFPVLFFFPQIYEYVQVKLFESPMELLEARFDMNWTALRIWRKHFFFGAGAANYMFALDEPDIPVTMYDNLPVHNAYLYILAEIGLFGLIAYYGIIIQAMRHCVKAIKYKDLLIRGLGLAVLTAFVAYLLDGLFDPMFRQAVPYANLWLYIGLGVAFTRIMQEQETLAELESTEAVS